MICCMLYASFVAGHGFEPWSPGYGPGVLPLHYPAIAPLLTQLTTSHGSRRTPLCRDRFVAILSVTSGLLVKMLRSPIRMVIKAASRRSLNFPMLVKFFERRGVCSRRALYRNDLSPHGSITRDPARCQTALCQSYTFANITGTVISGTYPAYSPSCWPRKCSRVRIPIVLVPF